MAFLTDHDAAPAVRPLSSADIEAAFRRATSSFEGAKDRWRERARTGMTDQELAAALAYELYSEGGGSGYGDCPSYWFNKNGLKIWACWVNASGRGKPTVQGADSVHMARRVYGISSRWQQGQMLLFA